MYVYTCVHVYIYIYIHTYIHMHAHVLYIYVIICVSIPLYLYIVRNGRLSNRLAGRRLAAESCVDIGLAAQVFHSRFIREFTSSSFAFLSQTHPDPPTPPFTKPPFDYLSRVLWILIDDK